MNFLLIGRPGTGKTTAACSAAIADPPGLLIDIDKKADQMVNLKPLIKKGIIKVIPVNDKLVTDRLSTRALNPDIPPREQPTGYVTAIDILNDIVDDVVEEYIQYHVYILDSLSRLVEHLTRLLIYHRGKGKFGKKKEDDMNWPSWGSYKANLEEAFNVLTASDKHFICTVHEKTMTERTVTMVGPSQSIESEVVTGYKPLVDGQMREKLAGYFNEVYYMDVKDAKGEKPSQYRFRTKGSKYDARTSLVLPEFVSADLGPMIRAGEA